MLEEHRPKLLAVIRRRLGPALRSRLDAEDVLQSAFLRAGARWSADEVWPPPSAYAWLYRIVRDCLLDAWRAETRQCRDVRQGLPWPDESSVQMGLGLVSPDTGPGSAVARDDLQQRVRQALALLSGPDREILWMRHYDGLTFPQAAEVLGITDSAATLRYVRALKRLRKSWDQLHPRGGPGRE